MTAKLNKYVLDFLNESDSSYLAKTWESKANQTRFKKIFNKSSPRDSTNTPVRGKTSYLFFCTDKRNEVKKLHPEYNNKQITAALGSMWNEIKDNPRMRDVYDKLAEKDKLRYQNEKSCISESEEVKTPPKVTKRNKSAYLFFCERMRKVVSEENPSFSSKQVTSHLGALWNTIKNNPAEVELYENLAAEAAGRVTTLPQTPPPPVQRKTTSNTDTSENKTGGYHLYCAERRNALRTENPKSSAKEITKILSAEWKGMGKHQQQSYIDRAE